MHISRLLEELSLLSQPNKQPEQINQVLQQVEGKIKEAEALLQVINLTVGELKQPLTVALGLSDLLLAEIDRDDPIAVDLKTIGKQVRRIGEIINGIGHVTHNKPPH